MNKLITDPNETTLNWIFEFLEYDLEKLNEWAFDKLKHEAEYYFIGQWLYFPFEFNWFSREDQDMYRRRGVERSRTNYVWSGTFPWKDSLQEVQGQIKNSLIKILSYRPDSLEWDGYNPGGQKPQKVWGIANVECVFFINPETVGVGYRLVIPPSKEPVDDSRFLIDNAVLTFYRCQSGLKNGSIRKCDHCGKYFLHLTKKQRRYCSPRCASRASVKAYRDKRK